MASVNLSTIKKSDVLSSGLLSAYRAGGKTPSMGSFGKNLLLHVGGNILAQQITSLSVPESLTSLLDMEELTTALLYAGYRSYRGGKLKEAAMDGAEYIISEKISKIALDSLKIDNELFSSSSSA